MSFDPNKWKVGEWMSLYPMTVTADFSAKLAFFKMKVYQIRHFPVVENEVLVGIVSERDFRCPNIKEDTKTWDKFYQFDEKQTVQDFMTTDIHTVHTQDSLEDALEILTHHKFNALPVVDRNNCPVGILTSHDIYRAFLALFKELKQIQ